MELLSFLLMVAVPLGWIVWGLSKKGYFASVAIPPMLFLFFAVFSLNSDPILTEAQPDFCAPVVNSATVEGNMTSYESAIICEPVEPVEHPIAPAALSIINYAMLLGMFSVLFLVSKRLIEKVHKKPPLEE